MKKTKRLKLILLTVILLLIVLFGVNKVVLPLFLGNPFFYCKMAGTADVPDNFYKGAQNPEVIIQHLRKILNISDEVPTDSLEKGIIWRCMDHNVYACLIGANLPCASKANVSRIPTKDMNSYCASNPNSDFIPAVVTGHETIYEWRCKGSSAEAAKQVFQTDKQGYISDIWYKIEN